jgi:predicted membrane channel-forming protein YqfA (hemolysin III family)
MRRLRFNWVVFSMFPFLTALTLLGVGFEAIPLGQSQFIRAVIFLAWAVYCVLSTRGIVFTYNE